MPRSAKRWRSTIGGAELDGVANGSGTSDCAVLLFGLERGGESIAVGAVGMWKSGLRRFPRAVGRGGNLLLVFLAFHGPPFPRSTGPRNLARPSGRTLTGAFARVIQRRTSFVPHLRSPPAPPCSNRRRLPRPRPLPVLHARDTRDTRIVERGIDSFAARMAGPDGKPTNLIRDSASTEYNRDDFLDAMEATDGQTRPRLPLSRHTRPHLPWPRRKGRPPRILPRSVPPSECCSGSLNYKMSSVFSRSAATMTGASSPLGRNPSAVISSLTTSLPLSALQVSRYYRYSRNPWSPLPPPRQQLTPAP